MSDAMPSSAPWGRREGARHVDLEAFAPEEYRRRVLPFLIERLQQGR
jgi:hypothetical protein